MASHLLLTKGIQISSGRSMQVLLPTRSAVMSMVFCVALPLYSFQPRTLSLDEIVGRMQQAEADSRDHSIPYTATREYQLGAAGSPQPSSQVLAEINYYPPTAKDYSIIKSQGGDRGASIVRKVLDHEVQVTAHSELTAITSRNYDFALRGRDTLDGRECYLLQLTPKRQAVELIRGQAWVDASDFLVRRIEGTTAKSPSMWIKNLIITVNYGEVNGVWLQTSSRASADVRFAGAHILTSRDLDVRTFTFDAQKRSPSPPQDRRSNSQRAVSSAATWVAR